MQSISAQACTHAGGIDVDSNSSIDSEEFLASTVFTQRLEKEETMRMPLQHIASTAQRPALCPRLARMQGGIDVDSNGSIDYEEFLASTVSTQHLEKEETMRKAFQHFDADDSGYITRDELHAALQVCVKWTTPATRALQQLHWRSCSDRSACLKSACVRPALLWNLAHAALSRKSGSNSGPAPSLHTPAPSLPQCCSAFSGPGQAQSLVEQQGGLLPRI